MFQFQARAALAALSLSFACGPLAAETSLESVVVSATRSPEGIDPLLAGPSVTVIDSRTMRDRQVRTLADVLRDVPGASVSRAGPLGTVAQVRLRGGEANHTLVLVDGMEIADPFAGEFDFSLLQVQEGARVEVLRGPQSALYGSDAVGGVVHYMTLSGREQPGVSVLAEGGSFGTREIAARAAGVAGAIDYAISGGWQDSDGTPTARHGTRDIGASSRFASAKFAVQATDSLRLRAVGRLSRSAADFNDQDFDFLSPTYGFVVDTDDRSSVRSAAMLLAAEHGAGEDGLRGSLSVQAVDSRRDAYDSAGRQTGDEGLRLKASYVASLRFDAAGLAHRLVLAADRERESFRNTSPFATPAQSMKRHIDNTGLVAEWGATFAERASAGFALRHDHNDQFRDATTWRAQFGWRAFAGTQLHAAAGTGIKNPTPAELYGYDPDSFIGNPALKPERVRSWEIGVEQTLLEDRLRFGAVYVRSRLQDEIFTRFSPTFVASPDNREDDSPRRSVEVQATLRPDPRLTLDASFTWLHARENGLEEVRRAPRSGSLAATWNTLGGRLGLTTAIRYNGDARDLNFTAYGPPRVTLPAYTLVQLGADWRAREGLSLYARLENALDEDYEDVHTYRMPGRAGYAGVRWQP